jgi:hypothetical protein
MDPQRLIAISLAVVQKETPRGIDSSGTVGRQGAGGNDVVDMGMVTPTPTIP